jgi:hypothetical protein
MIESEIEGVNRVSTEHRKADDGQPDPQQRVSAHRLVEDPGTNYNHKSSNNTGEHTPNEERNDGTCTD